MPATSRSGEAGAPALRERARGLTLEVDHANPPSVAREQLTEVVVAVDRD